MKCAQAPKQNYLANHWHQEVTRCSVLTDPVDGGWSAWSAWSHCHHGVEQLSGYERTHPHNDNAEVCEHVVCCIASFYPLPSFARVRLIVNTIPTNTYFSDKLAREGRGGHNLFVHKTLARMDGNFLRNGFI